MMIRATYDFVSGRTVNIRVYNDKKGDNENRYRPYTSIRINGDF